MIGPDVLAVQTLSDVRTFGPGGVFARCYFFCVSNTFSPRRARWRPLN